MNHDLIIHLISRFLSLDEVYNLAACSKTCWRGIPWAARGVIRRPDGIVYTIKKACAFFVLPRPVCLREYTKQYFRERYTSLPLSTSKVCNKGDLCPKYKRPVPHRHVRACIGHLCAECPTMDPIVHYHSRKSKEKYFYWGQYIYTLRPDSKMRFFQLDMTTALAELFIVAIIVPRLM